MTTWLGLFTILQVTQWNHLELRWLTSFSRFTMCFLNLMLLTLIWPTPWIERQLRKWWRLFTQTSTLISSRVSHQRTNNSMRISSTGLISERIALWWRDSGISVTLQLQDLSLLRVYWPRESIHMDSTGLEGFIMPSNQRLQDSATLMTVSWVS